jgi:LmbE family N-acetylglucosaminyl deacetylase
VVRSIGQDLWRRLRRGAQALDEAELRALSPMLILSPHQDDETLGCGGLIAVACALGLAPRVAFVTDGAASHRGSPSWPPSRLARARRGEALQALAVLGVPPEDVAFLGWPDGEPATPGSARHERSLAQLRIWTQTRAPRSLWATWKGEPHCDHEATAQLADALALRLPGRPRRLDYLVWGWTRADLPKAHARAWWLNCPSTVALRRRALACHRTQTSGLIDDADEAFRLPPEVAALAERPGEIFLEAA